MFTFKRVRWACPFLDCIDLFQQKSPLLTRIIIFSSHLPVIYSMIIDQYLPYRHERQLNKHASLYCLPHPITAQVNQPEGCYRSCTVKMRWPKFRIAADIKINEICVLHFPIFFRSFSHKATNAIGSANPLCAIYLHSVVFTVFKLQQQYTYSLPRKSLLKISCH